MMRRNRDGAKRGGAAQRSGDGNRRTGRRNATEATPSETGTRLNKVIADAGVASRRAADGLIAEGRVSVNGRVVTELGTRVAANDRVSVDGRTIGNPERNVYVLLNKPKDTISTTSDERGRRTVTDVIGSKQRIYPVGRLDRNTTGVLLLTNDGELANRLMHPRHGIQRHYAAVIDKPLEFRHARAIAEGSVDLGGGDVTGPCEVVVEDKDRRNVDITLTEGRNREVRRLFEAFGYTVVRLTRRSYAGLTTRGLARGEWRSLTRSEVAALRRLVGLD